MDIAEVSRSLNVPVAAASETPPEQAADKRSIVRAVKAVNQTEMLGPDSYLAFQRDPETQRMVIQVLDRKTHELVSQIPAEYLLRLAEDARKLQVNAADRVG